MMGWKHSAEFESTWVIVLTLGVLQPSPLKRISSQDSGKKNSDQRIKAGTVLRLSGCGNLSDLCHSFVFPEFFSVVFLIPIYSDHYSLI